MLSLIAILLLLVIPLLMLSLHLTRWRHASQWFLVVVGILLVWPLVLFTHFSPPQSISYISWVPKSLFPLSPALLVDDISWPFSIALVTLGLTLVLTAVARVEQAEPSPEQRPTPSLRDASARITTANWPTWAGSLLIISMGLVAVQPGNLLTILLSWAAIDVIELLVLLAQVSDSAGRERAVIAERSHETADIRIIADELASTINYSVHRADTASVIVYIIQKRQHSLFMRYRNIGTEFRSVSQPFHHLRQVILSCFPDLVANIEAQIVESRLLKLRRDGMTQLIPD